MSATKPAPKKCRSPHAASVPAMVAIAVGVKSYETAAAVSAGR